MSRQISEPDWKVFRQLHALALERFCQRILSEIERVAADSSKNSHERYLAVYELLHERNRELAEAFDNPRRSAALWQLASLVAHRLLSEEEMARFSVETRDFVRALAGTQRA